MREAENEVPWPTQSGWAKVLPGFLEMDPADEPESATFACTGPAPFDNDTAPCCDEHEEEWTRKTLDRAVMDGRVRIRLVANAVGVSFSDMCGFIMGLRSLTYPARVRIRGVLG